MEKRTRRINKEVAGGNKISSGNKRKARKSIFLPSHRVQMKNNYDNQFQSVKRGIVYFMEFFIAVLFSSSSRASFVRHTCLLLAYSYVKKARKPLHVDQSVRRRLGNAQISTMDNMPTDVKVLWINGCQTKVTVIIICCK